MVITGRTRNAFALRGTRVRIPPSPFENEAESQNAVDSRFILSFSFFVFGRTRGRKNTSKYFDVTC